MKIRLHKKFNIPFVWENPNNGQQKKLLKGGFLLLESDPQMRTIYESDPYYGNFSVRVPYPHLLFGIKYFVDKNGKYVYLGQPMGSLTCFFANNSIKSLKDEVYYGITDMHNFGIVCTDHTYDGKTFRDLKSLVNFVINEYWSCVHRVPQEWKSIDIKDVSNTNWADVYNSMYDGYGNYYTNLFSKKTLEYHLQIHMQTYSGICEWDLQDAKLTSKTMESLK